MGWLIGIGAGFIAFGLTGLGLAAASAKADRRWRQIQTEAFWRDVDAKNRAAADAHLRMVQGGRP